jgi:hypothetical protein
MESVDQSLQNYLLIWRKIYKINPETEVTFTVSHRFAGLLVTLLTLNDTYYLYGTVLRMAHNFSEHFVYLLFLSIILLKLDM